MRKIGFAIDNKDFQVTHGYKLMYKYKINNSADTVFYSSDCGYLHTDEELDNKSVSGQPLISFCSTIEEAILQYLNLTDIFFVSLVEVEAYGNIYSDKEFSYTEQIKIIEEINQIDNKTVNNILSQMKVFNPFKQLKIKKKIMYLCGIKNNKNIITGLNCCTQVIDYDNTKIPNPANCFYRK